MEVMFGAYMTEKPNVYDNDDFNERSKPITTSAVNSVLNILKV